MQGTAPAPSAAPRPAFRASARQIAMLLEKQRYQQRQQGEIEEPPNDIELEATSNSITAYLTRLPATEHGTPHDTTTPASKVVEKQKDSADAKDGWLTQQTTQSYTTDGEHIYEGHQREGTGRHHHS
eukprot:gene12031-25211_t